MHKSQRLDYEGIVSRVCTHVPEVFEGQSLLDSRAHLVIMDNHCSHTFNFELIESNCLIRYWTVEQCLKMHCKCTWLVACMEKRGEWGDGIMPSSHFHGLDAGSVTVLHWDYPWDIRHGFVDMTVIFRTSAILIFPWSDFQNVQKFLSLIHI